VSRAPDEGTIVELDELEQVVERAQPTITHEPASVRASSLLLAGCALWGVLFLVVLALAIVTLFEFGPYS
jgi:hypothetical protein